MALTFFGAILVFFAQLQWHEKLWDLFSIFINCTGILRFGQYESKIIMYLPLVSLRHFFRFSIRSLKWFGSYSRHLSVLSMRHLECTTPNVEVHFGIIVLPIPASAQLSFCGCHSNPPECHQQLLQQQSPGNLGAQTMLCKNTSGSVSLQQKQGLSIKYTHTYRCSQRYVFSMNVQEKMRGIIEAEPDLSRSFMAGSRNNQSTSL